MVLLLLPCLILHLMAVPDGFKQPVRNVSSCVAEFGRCWNYVKLFLDSSTFHVSVPYMTVYSGYA